MYVSLPGNLAVEAEKDCPSAAQFPIRTNGWPRDADFAALQARLEELIEVARGIQTEINQGEVGRVEEVLVEKRGKEPGHMLGRTRRHKVVVFPGGERLQGSYRAVELKRTTGATFVGSLVDRNDAEPS